MFPSHRGLAAIVLVFGPSFAQSPLEQADRPFPADELVAPADYDGDGDLDGLAWTNGAFDGRILVNDGHARFTAVPALGLVIPAGTRSSQVIGADLNGDGFGDVVFHDQGGIGAYPGNALFLGGPGSVFAAAPPLPTPTPNPAAANVFVTDATVLDVDLDGDLDLVVTTTAYWPWSDGIPELWINVGGGRFVSVAGAFGAAPAPAVEAKAVDLDLDGLLDVVFAGSFNGASALVVSAFRNTGGAFVAWPTLPSTLPSLNLPEAASFGDVNGDGFVDLAYLSSALSSLIITVRLGGPAGFGTPVVSSPPVLAGGRLQLLDLDADGAAEAVLGGGAGSVAVTVLDLTPTGAAGAVLWTAAGPVRLSPPVDFDADGDVDFASAFQPSTSYPLASPGLLFGAPGSTFVYRKAPGALDGVMAHVTGSVQFGVAVGDVDADGIVDLLGPSATFGAAGGSLQAGLSDGSRGFSFPSALNFGGPVGLPTSAGGLLPTRARIATDVDLDGDADYFVRCATSTAASPSYVDCLFLNLGGSFAAPLVVPASGAIACPSCAAGAMVAVACDVDLDGDADVAVAGLHGTLPTSLSLALNGGGLFLGSAPLGAPQITRDLLVGDFDGDGYDDVLQLGASLPAPAGSVLWRSQVGGPIATPLPTLSGEFAAVGDLNADGVDDLVLDGAAVLFAVGGGFTAAPALTSALRAPGVLGDLDEDGDLDLVEAPGTVMMNLGGGVFGAPDSVMLRFPALPPNLAPGGVLYAAYRSTLADLDRDGDLDLIAPGPTVLTNRTRILSHDGPPRVGRPTGVKLGGSPGQGFALFASAGVAQFSWPPYGTVLIDPTTAVLAATGAFAPGGGPGAGEALVPYVIPNVPAFAGLTLHWQAIDLGSLRFTNRLTSVVGLY
jgi:hypothetical protein